MNTVSEVLVVGGQTTTTSYTETSSGVNAPPTNPPLYFTVTITAGLEKVNASVAAATTITGSSSSRTISLASGSATESRTSSGVEQAIVKGKWTLLSALFIIIYLYRKAVGSATPPFQLMCTSAMKAVERSCEIWLCIDVYHTTTSVFFQVLHEDMNRRISSWYVCCSFLAMVDMREQDCFEECAVCR